MTFLIVPRRVSSAAISSGTRPGLPAHHTKNSAKISARLNRPYQRFLPQNLGTRSPPRRIVVESTGPQSPGGANVAGDLIKNLNSGDKNEMAEIIEIRGEKDLVEELAVILRNAVTRLPRFRVLGVSVPFAWLCAHCDDDPALARLALLAAGFTPDDGDNWHWRRGMMSIFEIIDSDVLGDTLVDIVDVHRPIQLEA